MVMRVHIIFLQLIKNFEKKAFMRGSVQNITTASDVQSHQNTTLCAMCSGQRTQSLGAL